MIGLYPVGGEETASAINESAWDTVTRVIEDVTSSWLEDGPDAIDPNSELSDMDKNIDKEVLSEYQELLEDANKTAGEAIDDDFFPDFEELFERVNDALNPDDDGDSNPPPNSPPPDNNPPKNQPLPPYCPPDTGCGG